MVCDLVPGIARRKLDRDLQFREEQLATRRNSRLGFENGAGDGGIIAPVEERVQALLEAIEATESHLRSLASLDPGPRSDQSLRRELVASFGALPGVERAWRAWVAELFSGEQT